MSTTLPRKRTINLPTAISKGVRFRNYIARHLIIATIVVDQSRRAPFVSAVCAANTPAAHLLVLPLLSLDDLKDVFRGRSFIFVLVAR